MMGVSGQVPDGGRQHRRQRIDSTFYTDLNASYTISGDQEWEIFLNVTNLLDEEPPVMAGVVGRTGTNEFNTALHDVLGRRYAIGFRLGL